MILSNANRILREIETISQESFLPIVGPHKGRVLVEVIRRIKPKRILEVGTLVGYSAILMGRELTSEAKLTTIEIDANEAEIARENIRNAQILPAVDVIVGDAIKVLPRLNGKFDLVFIDAGKTEYLDYICLVEDKLQQGSVIVADNAGIFADEMKDYLDYVRSSSRYRSRYIPFGDDGLEVTVRM